MKKLTIRKAVDLDKLNGNFIEQTPTELAIQNSQNIVRKHFSKFPYKCLIISDLHVRTHVLDNVRRAIKEGVEAGCNYLVILGDFADCHGLSLFDKNMYVPLKQELEACCHLLQIFSKNFNKILLVTSNHEERFLRAIRKGIDNPELLEVMGPQKSFLQHVVDNTHVNNAYVSERCYVQIGDCVMVHPDLGSRTPGSLAREACSTFIEMGEQPFNSIVVAHTHGHYESRHLNKCIIETPALCKRQDYMYRVSKRAWVSNGYTQVDYDKDGSGTCHLHVFKGNF
jgi:predicted phosphodiesterase